MATTPETAPVEELLTLPTVDDFPTQAVLHHPHPGSPPGKAALVIGAATGVPGIKFYASFARHLASHGHPVLVFDYRYLGRSFPPSEVPDPRDEDARTESLKRATDVSISVHWVRDAGAAIRSLHGRYCRGPGRELCYIGNSHGAHVLILAVKERDLVDRAMAVSTFSPHHGFFPDSEDRARGMKIVISASRQEGYFLATLMGRGMNEREADKGGAAEGVGDVEAVAAQAGVGYDLTLAAGEEWVRWCTMPRYMATEHFHAFTTFQPRQPFVSVGFADDPFTKGVSLPYDQMLYTMPLARTHRIIIDPKQMGAGWEKGCKHVDAFREKQKGGAWEMMRRWVDHGEEPRGRGCDRQEFGGTLPAFEKDVNLWSKL